MLPFSPITTWNTSSVPGLLDALAGQPTMPSSRRRLGSTCQRNQRVPGVWANNDPGGAGAGTFTSNTPSTTPLEWKPAACTCRNRRMWKRFTKNDAPTYIDPLAGRGAEDHHENTGTEADY